MPDSRSIIYLAVPSDRGPRPVREQESNDAIIESTDTSVSKVTYSENQLNNVQDEKLFDYYVTSQPIMVDVETGRTEPFGRAAVYFNLNPSPSGAYVLSVRLLKPYPHRMAFYEFPQIVEILDRRGATMRTLVHFAAEQIASGVNVRPGPRGMSWRPDRPATWYMAGFCFNRSLSRSPNGARSSVRSATHRIVSIN